PLDAKGKLLDETREVDPRTQRGTQAARIVIAVMHARLIVIRRSPQQVIVLFEQDDMTVAAAQFERGHATEETAANNCGVALGSHKGSPRHTGRRSHPPSAESVLLRIKIELRGYSEGRNSPQEQFTEGRRLALTICGGSDSEP